MILTTLRTSLILGCVLVGWSFLAARPAAPPYFEIPGYRSVDKAQAIRIDRPPSKRAGQTGYLGVSVERGLGGLVIQDVQANSPAARAGLQKGDFVTHLDDQPVRTPEAFRERLQSRGPEETVKLTVVRAAKPIEVTATLIATSRPMRVGGARVYLGVQLGEAKEGEGVRIEQVTPSSPAAEAGLKKGDHLAKLDGTDLTRAQRLTEVIAERKPGDILTFIVRREGKELSIKVTLTERGRPAASPPPEPWKKEVFRLAVLGIEFADVKHNAKVTPEDWEEALFSRGRYSHKANATGQTVHGSLNDYFLEQSAGAFRLEGKVFDWVRVSKKRGDYVQGSGTSNKTALPLEALNALTAREGKEALAKFDGVLFLYAGERIQTNRGSLYYPHHGNLLFQSRRLPYVLSYEGGARMTTIGGLVKEFAQVIGLPDLAARPENVGSRGLGVWCALSNTFTTSQPQHLSAWAKEKMGWITPTVIDPTVKQKLILAPIENSPRECFKVLVRSDGSEYFLLENRRKKGFDADLPGEGLLIWRVVKDRPILECSHGIEGPAAPTLHLAAIPYPSEANNAFTPETIPSSRSPLGGGLPVHLSEIRRLPDGRITFHIGYEYR